MNPTQVATAVANQVGNPAPEPQLITAMITWFAREGGAGPQWGIPNNIANYNPANTSLKVPGSTDTPGNPGAPIQSYVNWDQGIAATAATIKQSNMAPIKAAILNNANCVSLSAAVASTPWGTPSFADMCGGGSVTNYGTGSSSTSTSSSSGSGGLVATLVGPLAQDLFKVGLYLVFVVAGLGMIVLGITRLTRAPRLAGAVAGDLP